MPSEQQIKVDCLMGRRVSMRGAQNDDYGVAAHIKKVIPISTEISPYRINAAENVTPVYVSSDPSLVQ